MPDTESTPSDLPSRDDLRQFIELEAREGIESFRWLATQLLQVATVLSIANLTVVGYATANKQAGMFLLGAAITFILLIAYAGGMRGAVPVLCRLLAIEKEVSIRLKRPVETGISLSLLNILGPEFLSAVEAINRIFDPIEKRKMMGELSRAMLVRLPTRNGTIILTLAILAQIVLVPMFVVSFQWKLF